MDTHNLYLEVAASIGFPGYVAFWALLGAWGGMVWEILRRCRGNPERRLCEGIGVGLAGGMVAHLVYSVTDAIPLGEKGGVVFWGVLGLTGVLWRSLPSRPAAPVEEWRSGGEAARPPNPTCGGVEEWRRKGERERVKEPEDKRRTTPAANGAEWSGFG